MRMQFSWLHFVSIMLMLVAGGPSAQAFNIGDYFPLATGNTWSYTGDDQLGSSIADDFTWTTPAVRQTVVNGVQAFRMVTDTVENTDSRDGDEDFWTLDAAGRLLFHGFKNGKQDDFTGGNFPAQTIIAQWPVLFGRRNLSIGDTVTSKTRATVLINTLFGAQNITTTITLTTIFDRIDPVVNTPAGRFFNVLHLTINLRAQAVVFSVPVNQEFRGSEIWLCVGVGMVMQDQKAQPNDGRVQALSYAKVGNQIYRNSVPAWWSSLE